jgi:hypothetical protein
MAGESVRETSRDDVTNPVTVAEHRSAATTGKGEPSMAPVNERFKPEPVIRGPAPGMKIAAGVIAHAPYAPPIDLDPRVVEQIPGFEDHKGYLASTQTAFSAAFEGLKQIAEGRATAAKNQAWNDYQQLLQVGGFAEKVHAKMCAAFDTATNALTQGIAHIEKELTQPLSNAAASPLAKEIREHVKSLKPDERSEFLAIAIRDNDMSVVNALLGAPHYLSGMPKSSHDYQTRKFREAGKPELVGRQEAMRAALELIQRRAHIIHSQVESAMGGKFATLTRVRDASSAAEKALAFGSANNPLVS